MSNTPIKKSFLFKLSPPFIRSLAPPNLLNVSKIIISNFCSIINIINIFLYNILIKINYSKKCNNTNLQKK